MQNQRQEMDGLAQVNVVLTSTNMEVLTQLAQLTTAIGEMQEQIKKLYKNTKPRRKYIQTMHRDPSKHSITTSYQYFTVWIKYSTFNYRSV